MARARARLTGSPSPATPASLTAPRPPAASFRRDNPALHKHHKLARSLLSAGFAKELKPDSDERRRLEGLVQSPPTTRLPEEDRELLWKFRYSLTKEKRALTKLLK